uniref:Piscidin-2 n=1 Tax=Anabas testudineus TaxID=64144 RepID=A0A7N6ALK6_ANATE
MKCIVAFLVLSMVVIMAEPGECFIDTLLHGIVHSFGKAIHGLLSGHGKEQQDQQDQQEQLDKRSNDYNPGRPGFN